MYDHKTRKESPSELRSSMDYINEYVAMPANTMFEEGTIEKMLQEIGFTEIVLMDLSENIRPTLRLFFVLAFVPYFIVKLLGLQTYFVNTMAGYEGYRGRRYWRYVAVTAKKPHNVPVPFQYLCQLVKYGFPIFYRFIVNFRAAVYKMLLKIHVMSAETCLIGASIDAKIAQLPRFTDYAARPVKLIDRLIPLGHPL